MPGFLIGGGNEGVPNTIEPLFSHRWTIKSLGPVSGLTLFLARDLTLPSLRIASQEINGGLITYKFAKGVKWDDVTVVFYDDGSVYGQLQEWLNKVYTNDKGIQSHSQYKQTSEFALLGGQGNPRNNVTLFNSWPTVVEQGRLTYTNSELKVITVILSYDWAEVKKTGK